MSKIIIPEGYKAKLDSYDTQKAITKIHQIFEAKLSDALNLSRVSAPLLVEASTGLNDDLNGVERKVEFDIKEDGRVCQVVQSLAKWKRQALKEYNFYVGRGLYTNMNAIRRDEDLDNIHSVYVDQWDWEKVINVEDRTIDFLKDVVKKIVYAICDTELELRLQYPALYELSYKDRNVSFITSQELEDMYPDLTSKEREHAYVKDYHTTCILQIGGALASGKPHDLRAPDYDDWQLNCDILFWNEILGQSLEVSSMGIRVSPESLDKQLTICNANDRRELPFHKALLNGELPYTIGGGIGQSRLCMLLMGNAHIGEVQSAIWDDETKSKCKAAGINIL
ncbi:MAG: aspartate--ammonia ligase [Clostridia bacterium]|nr:aspartate--ammonia ligase [Clostridia bacterium]